MEDFFSADVVKIVNQRDSMYFTYDVDGVVVQVKELCGVVDRIHRHLSSSISCAHVESVF